MNTLLLMSACWLLAQVDSTWKVATLDGQPLQGSIQQLDNKQLVLQTTQGAVTIPHNKLLGILPATELTAIVTSKKPIAWIEFVDQTRLPVAEFTSAKNKVTLTLLEGQQLTLDLKSINNVRFTETIDPTQKLGNEGSGSDQIGIRKKASIDFLEGIIGDVTAENVNFTMEGDVLPVNRTKVEALVFVQRNVAELPDPLVMIEDLGGAQYAVAELVLDKDQLKIKTVSQVETLLPLSQVKKFDFSAGKLQYLSDLKPDSVTVTPVIELPKQLTQLQQYFAPRFNQGRDDPQLRLGGQAYSKGIAIHSRTELVYKVPSKSRRFTALAGIDDSVGNEGHVVFKVLGDGKSLYEGSFRGGDKPAKLDIDVTGVRKLTLFVDYGEDLDVGDYFDLVDALVTK
jgi:hypothetical protein